MARKIKVKTVSRHARPKEFRRVVCVCAVQDIDIWRVSAPRILKFIDSDEYLLICPNRQTADFTAATPPGWKVVGESAFDATYDFKKIQKRVTGETKNRVGWLLQQFLKINAIIDKGLKDDDLVLIWDADTVPLKKLRFRDPGTGVIEYYHCTESNPLYFHTIQKMLHLEKKTNHSFVAQCFPTKVRWIREMVKAIAGNGRRNYIEKVLESLPGLNASEFSEYETMGTWNHQSYGESIDFKKKYSWTRHGMLLLGANFDGYFHKLSMTLLSLKFDFMAFEKYEKDVSLVQWVIRSLKTVIRSPGKLLNKLR